MPLPETFRALILEKTSDAVSATVKDLSTHSLPGGDVVVSVAYSSLNYKDALAVTNRWKIVRRFPMVPGIDFSGTVVESKSSRFQPGDKVVLTGWGVGEERWGGLAQLARVKAEWLLPLPDGLTLKRAMAIGTAGLTAMFCVMVLEEHGVRPDNGEVLVTGATGGVGCIAVMLLAGVGYRVVASTGEADAHEFLKLSAHGMLSVATRSRGAATSRSNRDDGRARLIPLAEKRWRRCSDRFRWYVSYCGWTNLEYRREIMIPLKEIFDKGDAGYVIALLQYYMRLFSRWVNIFGKCFLVGSTPSPLYHSSIFS